MKTNLGRKFPNRKRKGSLTEEHRANISKNNARYWSGKKRPESMKEKMRNEKHPNWKGDEVSYWGIHKWVIRHKGQPDTCEKCGKSGLYGRKINWANVDNRYRRVLDDYIRLCVTCHSEHDRNINSNSGHFK